MGKLGGRLGQSTVNAASDGLVPLQRELGAGYAVLTTFPMVLSRVEGDCPPHRGGPEPALKLRSQGRGRVSVLRRLWALDSADGDTHVHAGMLSLTVRNLTILWTVARATVGRAHVSYVSCSGGRVFTTRATWAHTVYFNF